MKLAFYRAAQATHLPSNPLPYQTGVPISCGSTLRDHLGAERLVGNLGNMIHRMAMIQLLEFDRTDSGQVQLPKLIAAAGSAEAAAEQLNGRYDGLVITMSNVLRANASEPNIAALIKQLKIPVYCVGIGLQDELPAGQADALTPDMLELMRVLDEKATLFGVRGERTKAWLDSIGIKNSKAIGCPSMFAYPQNVLSVKSPEQPTQFITAGHLQLTSNMSSRIHRLIRGFRGIRPAYVFQGEVAHFKDLMDQVGVYNEATQTFNHEILTTYISKRFRYTPPFSRYYSFADASAWRMAYTNYDVFAGDRIHGGVAALQVGVPALILCYDARVQELATFHGIPSCSIDEFESIGCRAALEKYMDTDGMARFHERYTLVLENFERTIKAAGLSTVARLAPKEGNTQPASESDMQPSHKGKPVTVG